MYLELAERPSKFISVASYKRKSTVSAHRRKRPTLSEDPTNNYIFIPPHLNDGINGFYIREDKFDDLSEQDWNDTMDELLQYQPNLADLSSKESRKAKKELKKIKKAAKVERKNKKVAAKTYKKEAKGQAKVIKAQAKQDRANNPEAQGKFGGVFKNVLDTVGGVVKKYVGGGSEQELPTHTQTDKNESSDTVNILGMELSKPVAYIGGIALAVGTIQLIRKAVKK